MAHHAQKHIMFVIKSGTKDIKHFIIKKAGLLPPHKVSEFNYFRM